MNLKGMDSPDRYHVPNLLRALSIIEHLASRPAGATQAELARDLDLPKNSVLRIAQTLVDEGYLLRDPETRVYRLSRKLLSLGFASIGEEGLLEKSLDILRELRNATREPAMIGILMEREGVVLESVPGLEPVRLVVEQGTHFPLHTAAPAKAILAFLPDEARAAYLATIRFERFTPTTIGAMPAFLKELEVARRKGYAFDRAEQIEGMMCVSSPVRDHRGHPIAAIWITGPIFRLPARGLEAAGKVVAAHAARISARFGWSEPSPSRGR